MGKRELVDNPPEEEHGHEFPDYVGWDIQRQTRFALNLQNQSSFLSSRPFAHSECNVANLAERMEKSGRGQFAWALSFDPNFIARLARFGFLPMAGKIFSNLICLLPKLHTERCILDFANLKVSRSTRKKSKKFSLTVDKDFEACIRGCQAQHGKNCWFYRPLTQAYRKLFRSPICGVRIHSIEIWQGETLVGGEVGYSVGRSYTSLSGFRIADGAGTVQCVCTAKLLESCGFDFWDLGMPMEYKSGLGAKSIKRDVFLSMVSCAVTDDGKGCRANLVLEDPKNCKDLLVMPKSS